MCVYCTTRDKSKKEKVYHVVLCFFISIIVNTQSTRVCVYTQSTESTGTWYCVQDPCSLVSYLRFISILNS